MYQSENFRRDVIDVQLVQSIYSKMIDNKNEKKNDR